MPLSQGALPQIVVRDGVAHIVSVAPGTFVATTFYTRVDADGVMQARVFSAGIGLAPPHEPTVVVTDDGTLIIGSQGHVFTRGPEDRDERMVPIRVTIQGTGRVTSSDGLIDCTQSCTVMAPAARRLHLVAAGASYIECLQTPGGFYVNDPTMCDVDSLSETGQPIAENPVLAVFP